ncbi:hypothetical protein CCHR01_17681 [Colletotrichum chrysophilum]|uniref:Uncharacterized protein n=1 Tax=Colletotrichum chrysophilum TaxID=1836956 RepID=A0AAD9A208_9PEZI|nr:hypothetical protein CCHR01_17681 [Colletotrichum chrysophilum]
MRETKESQEKKETGSSSTTTTTVLYKTSLAIGPFSSPMSAYLQLERFNKPDVNCVLTVRQGQRQLPNLEGPCLLHWRDPYPCATAFGPGKHRKAELGGTGAVEIKKGQLHRDFAMLMSELRDGGCVWLRRRKSSAAPFWPPFSALRAELRSGRWIWWSSKRLCSQELANARIPVSGIQRVSDGTGMTEEKERTDLSRLIGD